jgi:hypothetical protein
VAETALPDVEITGYYVETLVATAAEHEDLTASTADALGMYLLDLMDAQGWRIVSGVRYTFPPPTIAPHPDGFCVLRAEVSVQEFDITIPE